MSLIKDLIQALTKKREKFNRTIVWFCLISLLLDNATLEGAGAVTFLFTSARLGWGITEFSTFSAANFLIGSFGSLTAVKFGSGVFSKTKLVIQKLDYFVIQSNFFRDSRHYHRVIRHFIRIYKLHNQSFYSCSMAILCFQCCRDI